MSAGRFLSINKRNSCHLLIANVNWCSAKFQIECCGTHFQNFYGNIEQPKNISHFSAFNWKLKIVRLESKSAIWEKTLKSAILVTPP